MSRPVGLLVLLLVIAAIVVWLVYRSRSPRIGEIAPASVLQQKYGLYAENRPIIHLNPDRVPSHLRDLIPLAEKWGIGDDIIRMDVEERATDSERRVLVDALKNRYEQINAWLDSADAADMTDEMAAFMYLAEAAEEVKAMLDDHK
jgi:hypothetical protein